MREPTFLLQKGDAMATEKVACSLSNFPFIYLTYDKIEDLPKDSIYKFIPVGSVEFTQKYADHVGITLPANLSYYPYSIDEKILKRKIKKGKLKDASSGEFVKPFEKIKLFTGGIKDKVLTEYPSIDEEEDVWISEPVPFESEFRFYVQSYVSGWDILGWTRYDPLRSTNPDPDIKLVERVAEVVHKDLGPNAYSIDIGWRPDIQEYDVVEMNDAWALGLYRHSDFQSKPPGNQQYANMLYSRWFQIVFCNIV